MEKLIEFQKVIDDLKDSKMNIDDEDKTLLMLSSLSKSFQHF